VTYSIVARDPDTGELGVAVQSCWFSVGSMVPWAESEVGAVATQAFADPSYGPLGLALMRAGRDAPAALAGLLAADEGRERRQIGMVDARGVPAAHTGSQCIVHAGHVTATNVTVQANIMRSDQVWPAMIDAYHAARGDLAERLLAALDAGEVAGGDARGRQSAAILVVAGTRSGQPWRDRLVDLRVEDSRDPLGELRRLLNVHRGYGLMEEAEQCEAAGDLDGALRAYEQARARLPGNDEAAFWSAVLIARAGRPDESRALLAEVASREPGWLDVLKGLPATGLFAVSGELVESLVS